MVRESKWELARIVCTVMIILRHMCTLWGATNTEIIVNKFLSNIFFTGGELAVDVFVMISAWFLVEQHFSSKRFFKIWLEAFFYNIVIYILCLILGCKNFTFRSFSNMLFPALGGSNWFVSAYLGMVAAMPITNYLIKSMSLRIYRYMIFLGAFCFSIFPSTGIVENVYVNDLLWFIYIYFLMGYIKKYRSNFISHKNIKWLFFSSYIFMLIIEIVMQLWGMSGLIFSNLAANNSLRCAAKPSDLLVVLGALGLFGMFSRLEIKNSNKINYISKTTFGIFLYHSHLYFYAYFGENILKTSKYINSSYFIIYVIVVLVVIFLIGFLFDTIRIFMFERPVINSRFFKGLVIKVDSWIDNES